MGRRDEGGGRGPCRIESENPRGHRADLVGFAAYECTRKDFFGPTGVIESERGRGLGRALLLASLWGLRELGYAYAVIGGVGPAEFYERAVGARLIPDSDPGVYADPLRDS